MQRQYLKGIIMFNPIKVIITLIVGLFLAGCATNQSKVEERIVYKTRTLYVVPPANFLGKTDLVPPPDKAAYLAMSWEQRANLLTEKYIKQTEAVGMCNKDKEAVVTWSAKTLELSKEQEEKKSQ